MSISYDNYIYEHCENVIRGLQWMRDHIPEVGDTDIWAKAMDAANLHDDSKWDVREYDAYDRYFYGSRSSEVVRKFDYAWLHHIHNNPHHWQYWLLFQDDPKGKEYVNPETGDRIKTPFKALEMPRYEILHMIADWWSFSWKSGRYEEIFSWYDSHRKKMILNPMTRHLVEDILLNHLRPALIKEGMIPDTVIADIPGAEAPKPDLPAWEHQDSEVIGKAVGKRITDDGLEVVVAPVQHLDIPEKVDTPPVEDLKTIVIEPVNVGPHIVYAGPGVIGIIQHSEKETDEDDKAKKYGVPEQEKFPMPDADHVRSAIRFFNYVDKQYEKELAEAILKRMKEYGMSFEDFGVGEENRFRNYIPKKDLEKADD